MKHEQTAQTVLTFQDVSFAYLREDAVEDPTKRTREDLDIICENLDLHIPGGMVSILGPNGTGKTTLMLLAGARLQPLSGSIKLLEHDTAVFAHAETDPTIEEARSRLAGFVYQNMEFETEEPLRELLELVAKSGGTNSPEKSQWLKRMPQALGLEEALNKKPQNMAKGELQKAVIAIALSYGSPVLFMDEPTFAMEEADKQKTFTFVRDWSRAFGVSVYFSAHDLDLCRDFADNSLLLWREDGVLQHRLGSSAEICGKESIEAAYHTPLSTLYTKEQLHRNMLTARK